MRLFTGFHETPGPIIEDLDEDVEIRDLTAYDSFGACNMFSQVSPEYSTEWFDLDDTAATEGVYTARCSHFDMSYSDHDGIWTCFDDNSEQFDQFYMNEPSDVCTIDNIRAVGYTDHHNVEVVLR